MNNMIQKCYNLLSLPDISKWKINKVTDISYIFCDCINLSLRPNISNWYKKQINKKNNLFS